MLSCSLLITRNGRESVSEMKTWTRKDSYAKNWISLGAVRIERCRCGD